MTPLARARTLGFGMAALTFLADQASKWAMLSPLHLREVGQIVLCRFFNLTFTQNIGVSLGLLSASTDLQRWGLVGLTALIALFVAGWMLREGRPGETLALGLVLGGALGNIADRGRLGYVVDFLDLHFGDFRPFMVFNLADTAITLGVLIILARSFLSREKREPNPGPRS